MKKELESKLDDIFSQHEAKKIAAAEKEDLAAKERKEYLEGFIKVRDGVIRPAMESVKSQLEKRGHRASISTDEPREADYQAHVHPRNAAIRLTIFLNGERVADHGQYPFFGASWSNYGHLVDFHQSTIAPGRGGSSGGAGNAKLEDITEDMIQEKLVRLVGELFK